MNANETGQVHSETVWLRPSRFTSNCGLTEYDAGSVPEGDITYLRQAASFDIHQTDTGPANFMDVELIPLCGFGHTEEKWLTTSERCIRNVLAFDIAALLQTLAECGHQASGVAERGAAEKPNHRRRQLLRARRERPDGGPTKQRDDLASSYVEHGLLPGTRCASLQQAQDVPEAPAGPWGSPESF